MVSGTGVGADCRTHAPELALSQWEIGQVWGIMRWNVQTGVGAPDHQHGNHLFFYYDPLP